LFSFVLDASNSFCGRRLLRVREREGEREKENNCSVMIKNFFFNQEKKKKGFPPSLSLSFSPPSINLIHGNALRQQPFKNGNQVSAPAPLAPQGLCGGRQGAGPRRPPPV